MSMSDAVVGQLMNNIINHPQDCDCISMESVRQGLATDLAEIMQCLVTFYWSSVIDHMHSELIS